MEVVLLAKKAGHATVIVFEWADWGALYTHPTDIKPVLL